MCATAVLQNININQNDYDDIDVGEVKNNLTNKNIGNVQNNQLGFVFQRKLSMFK